MSRSFASAPFIHLFRKVTGLYFPPIELFPKKRDSPYHWSSQPSLKSNTLSVYEKLSLSRIHRTVIHLSWVRKQELIKMFTTYTIAAQPCSILLIHYGFSFLHLIAWPCAMIVLAEICWCSMHIIILNHFERLRQGWWQMEVVGPKQNMHVMLAPLVLAGL